MALVFKKNSELTESDKKICFNLIKSNINRMESFKKFDIPMELIFYIDSYKEGLNFCMAAFATKEFLDKLNIVKIEIDKEIRKVCNKRISFLKNPIRKFIPLFKLKLRDIEFAIDLLKKEYGKYEVEYLEWSNKIQTYHDMCKKKCKDIKAFEEGLIIGELILGSRVDILN